MIDNAAFPRTFAWGVASASYQVEGSPTADGKGPSVWDMFCRKPGAIWGGQTGDTACDGYRRWRGDVALMKELGIKAYRFSVSWPRVLPEGTGAVNRKGLDFYRALVASSRG
jgi:beta-glucosidase